MSQYEYPIGLEPYPPSCCGWCSFEHNPFDEKAVWDWDHFDYHYLAKHFEQMVEEFAPYYANDAHATEYRAMLLAKKQRLQKSLGL